ncbi:HNH endonuclease family protein [Streptomyces boncukensis]|uniref:DUF1524 domain-containing protein n=1 Tax=Streptomyces boncukensis TaxID=2711219 RepID=A0A6G4WTW5_9ACTN|nr:HNH endonuclease family protein [Streptomyces boncukensis]NGO68716.1 DUF1524 domain-containing protein [Streptomyces boncukensis]
MLLCAAGISASALLLTACDSATGEPADGSGGSGGSGRATRAVSPLDNPDGTKPGLAPVTGDDDRAAARALIGKLRTAGRGPKTGYARDKFGYAWMDTADGVPLARNGCDTRNDLLARDGEKLRYRSGSDCVVVAMTVEDPYTGKRVAWKKERATEIQIDHVMPLSYDWQMGAARWPEERRKQIANDPLNLLASDGPANASKGDAGPASWLPPNKRIRCAYAVRFAQVAQKYELPVTAPDKRTMLDQCV